MTAPDPKDAGSGGQAAGDGKSGKGDYGPAPTMGDLRSMVSEVVEGALKPFMDKLGSSSSPAVAEPGKSDAAAGGPAAPHDLDKMVNDALAKVLGDRDSKAAEDAHKKQHEQLAAAAERRPLERPRRSRWLGNIWDRE